jgi:hypothetical protein
VNFGPESNLRRYLPTLSTSTRDVPSSSGSTPIQCASKRRFSESGDFFRSIVLRCHSRQASSNRTTNWSRREFLQSDSDEHIYRAALPTRRNLLSDIFSRQARNSSTSTVSSHVWEARSRSVARISVVSFSTSKSYPRSTPLLIMGTAVASKESSYLFCLVMFSASNRRRLATDTRRIENWKELDRLTRRSEMHDQISNAFRQVYHFACSL